MIIADNEKLILKEIEAQGGRANAVLISYRLNLNPIEYVDYLCKRLKAKGYLEKVSPGRYPVYGIRVKEG